MKRYLKYLLFILEVTSIPLLFTITLMVLSGYGILYPKQIKVLTGGLMNRKLAIIIHTDTIIRLITVVLLYFHGISGLLILIEKYIRTRLLKNILILVSTLIITYIYLLMIWLDVLR